MEFIIKATGHTATNTDQVKNELLMDLGTLGTSRETKNMDMGAFNILQRLEKQGNYGTKENGWTTNHMEEEWKHF